MRFIEDFRDKHKGREIWILGSGPSLDDFPDDFFNEKISIAINWSIIAFPQCTYWHGHHESCREYLRDEKPEFLPKSIILLPFSHYKEEGPERFFGKLKDKPIWMRWRDIRPIPKKAIEQAVECIMAKEGGDCFRASMTVTHTAIEAAVVLGAKKVTLVGCEHKSTDQTHAQRRGMAGLYRMSPAYFRGHFPDWGQKPGDPRVTQGTQWLAELFGKHGIEIRRYYFRDTEFYKKGYEKII